MAMFVTFYSFKGGVGRTLALANVATRLAQDTMEPCRVLVWDFDLAAPGLQQVFKCQKGKKRGFIDLVHEYLTEAKIGNVSDCISKTDVAGVDLLSAGYMNRQCAARLDRIHWREIYEQARGFNFIEDIKRQISEIHPSYDYVLIDSLTGYSDVGGICVNQLPDIVVLLFRLNQQNLTGISKVYQGIRSADSNKPRPSVVVPVISPSWPFASPEADEWLSKVKRLFQDEEDIFSISFEGSLTFGEKILSKEKKGYLNLRINDDYEALTDHLRSLNSQDLKTIYGNIWKFRDENQFREALEACVKLIKQRPEVSRYWRQLVSTVSLAPRLLRDKMRDAAKKIVDDQADASNPLALIARADLAERFDPNWLSAYDALTRAIEVAPDFAESYFSRGAKCFQHRKPQEAITDFSRFIELQRSSGDNSLVPAALLQRGLANLRLGNMESSLADLTEAVKLEPTEDNFLVYRATALLLAHRYKDVEKDIEKALELSSSNYEAQIFKAHLFAIEMNNDAAKRELQKVEAGGISHFGMATDLAEVYLIIDPPETLRVLREYLTTSGQFAAVSAALKVFAAELMSNRELIEQSLRELSKHEAAIKEQVWVFSHLREFLHWAPERNVISREQEKFLRELLEYVENPSTQPPSIMNPQLTLS